MTRLRVLISTHEFSPEQGSECAVGWNIATRLAAFHDVTVLCANGPVTAPDSYRNAIERYVGRNGELAGMNIVFVPQPPAALKYARMNRKLMKLTGGVGWQPLFYIGLDAWHRAAFQIAHELGFRNFDVVHQLTPISFIRPGYLWEAGLPLFWGPLGGMFKVPLPFALSGGVKSFLFEGMRSANILRQIRKETFINVVRKSRRIWTVTENEYRVVNDISVGKAVPMIDTAPPEQISGQIRSYDGTAPLKLCWSGTHEPRKALPLVLRAMARLSEKEKVHLEILGEGSETQKWRKLASRLRLRNVTWRGRVPYREALKIMNKSDIFVHSSFREAASMVVLEALGWGMPVICHDACGMAIAVDSTCGIKVEFSNPERSINGFHDALLQLVGNPERVERLSQGALRRASELSWEAKVKEISEAYLEAYES